MPIIFLLSVIFFSAVAASSTELPGPPTALQSALALYRRGELPESRAILERLVRAHPETALYWFNLGNVLTRQHAYGPAIQAYLRVRALESPLTLPSDIYRAACYRAT